MSLETLVNTVPCSVCKLVQIPCGKMGDTGKKKCPKCKYQTNKQYQAEYYRENKSKNRLKQMTCFKCGKTYDGRSKTETCEICEMVIVDLFNHSRMQECIYCGRPSGIRKFCSHNCLVKTTKLHNKRKRKIDEVLLDT